jgi:hypothetical protein
MKKNTKSFRLIKLPTKLMDYMAWRVFGSTAILQMHTFPRVQLSFFYIKKSALVSLMIKRHFLFQHGVLDDKKTFLVSALWRN